MSDDDVSGKLDYIAAQLEQLNLNVKKLTQALGGVHDDMNSKSRDIVTQLQNIDSTLMSGR